MAEHHGRPGEGLPRFIMEDEHSYVHGPNSGATTHHVHGSLQSQAATDFNSGVERLHPTEIKEGDMVLKQPHHTPFKAQEVKHYKGWSSCWADDKGPGHRVEFSHDEPAFRLKGKQASLQTTAASWGRRHYEDLASVLSKHGDAAAAKHFANHLASTNTAYKPEQFLRAAESPSYQKRSSGTPVYTQSHYQHIAAGVASFPGNKHALANTLATHLSNSAGKFDQKRFMKAAIGDTTKAPKPPKPAIASLPEPGSARRTAAPLDPDMSAAPGQTGPDAGETDDEGMMDDANVTGFTPGQTVTVEYQMPDGTTGTCDAVVQTVNPDGSIAFTYDNGAFTVSDAGDGTYADAQGATFEIQPADADAAQDVTGGDPEDAPGGGKPPSKNKNPFGAQASLAHDEEASRDWHQRRRTAGNPFDGTDPANPFNVAAPDPAAAPGADMPGAPPPPPPAAAPAPGAGAPPAPLAAPATSPDGQGDPDMDDDGTSPKSQAMSLLVAHVRSTNPSISVQAARSLAAEALSRYPVLETVNA